MKKRFRWLLYGIMVMLLVMLAAMTVGNAKTLGRTMDEHTRNYVSDVSGELARNIDYRLNSNMTTLETLAESVQRMETFDKAYIYDYMERKIKARGFDSVVIVEADGKVYQSDSELEDVASLPGVRASFCGRKGVSILTDRNILYSIPMEWEGKVAAVIGGLRDGHYLEDMVQPVSFDGKGSTCIINKDGKVIVWNEGMKPVEELTELFSENPASALAENILLMEKNIKKNLPGTFRFNTVKGDDMILDYHPLHSFGWTVLTLVPGDIISGHVIMALRYTYIIFSVVGLLLILALLHIFTNRIRHYKLIQKAAMTDPLTGEMNGAAFMMKCKEKFANARAEEYTILWFHIRHFKLINKLFGLKTGDQLLCKVMEIMKAQVEKDGFAAHGDADNFYLCIHSGSERYVRQVFDGIMTEVEQLIQNYSESQDAIFPLVLNAGAYIVDDPDKEISLILDCASVAAREREATEDGICKFYEGTVMDSMETEQSLNGMLQEALDEGQFITYLQPKVGLKDDRVCGVEALVRWIHPEKGMISPGEFIPVFERNGKICEIDVYVFEQTCKAMRCWIDSGHDPIPASVNLSRQHFQHKNFLEKYIEIANRYRIPAGVIELELTESIFIEEEGLKNIKNCIRKMHEHGFLCSIDDFGAGYSALGLLSEFDIDTVKLDRRFFLNIGTEKARVVVKKMVELAKEIGAGTVAEGIETQEQLDFVKEIQCDCVQGFYFARPMPIADCEAWLDGLCNYTVVKG